MKSFNSTTCIEQQLYGWYVSETMETNSNEDVLLVFFLSSWTGRGIHRHKIGCIFLVNTG